MGMIFWRRKNNSKEQDQDARDERLLHREKDPDIEPSTDYESDLSEDQKHDLKETEEDIIEELDTAPVPSHTILDDVKELEELSDHTEEGG